MARERGRVGSPLQLSVFHTSNSPLILGAARLAVAATTSIVKVDGDCVVGGGWVNGREAEGRAVTARKVLG